MKGGAYVRRDRTGSSPGARGPYHPASMKGGAYVRRDLAGSVPDAGRAPPASMKGGAYVRRDLQKLALRGFPWVTVRSGSAGHPGAKQVIPPLASRFGLSKDRTQRRDGMTSHRLWARAVGVEGRAAVERVVFDTDGDGGAGGGVGHLRPCKNSVARGGK